MRISVASNIGDLSGLLRRYPEIAQRELDAGVARALAILQGALMVALPKGAGGRGGGAGLSASVMTEQAVTSETVLGMVGTELPYAEYVEIGTQPHFPPITPLQEWVTAVLGIAGDAARSVAFAIARAISIRGTKPNPVWQTVADQQRSEVERQLAEAVLRITDAFEGGAA